MTKDKSSEIHIGDIFVKSSYCEKPLGVKTTGVELQKKSRL